MQAHACLPAQLADARSTAGHAAFHDQRSRPGCAGGGAEREKGSGHSIIFRVSDAVIIPTILDFFETRMHFEYLISGTRTFAGVS